MGIQPHEKHPFPYISSYPNLVECPKEESGTRRELPCTALLRHNTELDLVWFPRPSQSHTEHPPAALTALLAELLSQTLKPESDARFCHARICKVGPFQAFRDTFRVGPL